MALVVGEGSVKEGIHYLESEAFAQHPCAHGKHICVVMLTGGLSGEAVRAECGAHARDLVCGDGDTDTGAADKDALVALACCNGLSHGLAVDRIVTGSIGLGAVILVFKATLVKVGHNRLLKFKTAVVAADSYHCIFLRETHIFALFYHYAPKASSIICK